MEGVNSSCREGVKSGCRLTLAILLGPLPYGERFIYGMTPAIWSALANTIGSRSRSNC
jgi:hypothetical protein